MYAVFDHRALSLKRKLVKPFSKAVHCYPIVIHGTDKYEYFDFMDGYWQSVYRGHLPKEVNVYHIDTNDSHAAFFFRQLNGLLYDNRAMFGTYLFDWGVEDPTKIYCSEALTMGINYLTGSKMETNQSPDALERYCKKHFKLIRI